MEEVKKWFRKARTYDFVSHYLRIFQLKFESRKLKFNDAENRFGHDDATLSFDNFWHSALNWSRDKIRLGFEEWVRNPLTSKICNSPLFKPTAIQQDRAVPKLFHCMQLAPKIELCSKNMDERNFSRLFKLQLYSS